MIKKKGVIIITRDKNTKAQKEWNKKVEEFKEQQKGILGSANLEKTLEEWSKQSSSAPPTTEMTLI